MVGFTTDHNTYYVDTAARLITGGKLGNEVLRYRTMGCIENVAGYVEFEDGGTMTTSPVRKILSAQNVGVAASRRIDSAEFRRLQSLSAIGIKNARALYYLD